ncbi:hypothetical protein [Streptomyces sp. NPDC006551]|uniref:hypothetical protein n=1 Tax=Streptomyces sp. NPDC006551 TaxID=3157178 RepID=UPI0033A68601
MACWIVIAYLSGMRDAEVRALTRNCATTTTSPTGRRRHMITGRVFKHRKLTGAQAEWIVLDIVHEAVDCRRTPLSAPPSTGKRAPLDSRA